MRAGSVAAGAGRQCAPAAPIALLGGTSTSPLGGSGITSYFAQQRAGSYIRPHLN